MEFGILSLQKLNLLYLQNSEQKPTNPTFKYFLLFMLYFFPLIKSYLNKYIWWVEFDFNQLKKVLDSVRQSEYHNITQYTSKIKI